MLMEKTSCKTPQEMPTFFPFNCPTTNENLTDDTEIIDQQPSNLASLDVDNKISTGSYEG